MKNSGKKPPDLTKIFQEWEYDEEDNVRFLIADDGREVMQIRQPLGIEQYDLDGRPDGRKPQECSSFGELFLHREENAQVAGTTLVIEDKEYRELRDEAILFYYRYLVLFQVGQYDRVIRDTNHNLSICRIVAEYYDGEDRFEMLQYQPYIRRMNAIAKAMMLLSEDENSHALEELEKGQADIEAYDQVPTPIFEFERIRSLQHLAHVISQVEAAENEEQTPKGFKDRLLEELHSAVEQEDYELAARLRDRLRRLEN